jgi:hypothetical protein
LEPEVREGADVDVVYFGVAAHLLIRRNKFAAICFREFPAAGFIDVSTGGDFVSNIPVSLRVFP